MVFRGGPLPQAIRASISIPGLFAPVEYRGHYLVDGAIMDNLPTDVVKQDLHADVVLAVHLKSTAFSAADVNSIVGVFTRAYSAGTARTERSGEGLATVLMTADTAQLSTSDYGKAAYLIASWIPRSPGAGLGAGKICAQPGRVAGLPGGAGEPPAAAERRENLQMVKVEGGSAGAQAEVKQRPASRSPPSR